MNENVKVSVIIPVYNAEKHLRQCIESVLAQTLREIEIICVDDGSDDESVSILEEYQKQDPRLMILKQDHQFAGTARNYGKSIAKGEYLVFWDADDYFDPDALKEMYEQCQRDDADICICSGSQYFEDGEYEAPSGRYIRKSEIPAVIPFCAKSEPDHIVSITVEAPWNKMFRRSFIEEHRLDFQPIRNANDVFFVISALCIANRVTICQKRLVCYRKNRTGLVATVSKSLIPALNAWRDTAGYLKSNDALPLRSFANRALESIIYLLNNTHDWDSFSEGFTYVKNEKILDDLCIYEHEEEDWYYVDYHAEALRILRNGTPQEFAKFMWRVFYRKETAASSKRRFEKEKYRQEIRSKKDEISRLKEEKQQLQDSLSFKAGRALTWGPRKIKEKLKSD